MRSRLRLALLLLVLPACGDVTGNCMGPWDTIVSGFTGTVTRDGVPFTGVSLEGEEVEPILGEPWEVPRWSRNLDVLLDGGLTVGAVDGAVAGQLSPGPVLRPFAFEFKTWSPLALGDTLPAVEITTPGCSFTGPHADPPADSVMVCIGIEDSLIPRPLGVSGTVVVVQRRPLALQLDLLTDDDPRVRYAVRGRLTFRQGRAPRQCYGST